MRMGDGYPATSACPVSSAAKVAFLAGGSRSFYPHVLRRTSRLNITVLSASALFEL